MTINELKNNPGLLHNIKNLAVYVRSIWTYPTIYKHNADEYFIYSHSKLVYIVSHSYAIAERISKSDNVLKCNKFNTVFSNFYNANGVFNYLFDSSKNKIFDENQDLSEIFYGLSQAAYMLLKKHVKDDDKCFLCNVSKISAGLLCAQCSANICKNVRKINKYYSIYTCQYCNDMIFRGNELICYGCQYGLEYGYE